MTGGAVEFGVEPLSGEAGLQLGTVDERVAEAGETAGDFLEKCGAGFRRGFPEGGERFGGGGEGLVDVRLAGDGELAGERLVVEGGDGVEGFSCEGTLAAGNEGFSVKRGHGGW